MTLSQMALSQVTIYLKMMPGTIFMDQRNIIVFLKPFSSDFIQTCTHEIGFGLTCAACVLGNVSDRDAFKKIYYI